MAGGSVVARWECGVQVNPACVLIRLANGRTAIGCQPHFLDWDTGIVQLVRCLNGALTIRVAQFGHRYQFSPIANVEQRIGGRELLELRGDGVRDLLVVPAFLKTFSDDAA